MITVRKSLFRCNKKNLNVQNEESLGILKNHCISFNLKSTKFEINLSNRNQVDDKIAWGLVESFYLFILRLLIHYIYPSNLGFSSDKSTIWYVLNLLCVFQVIQEKWRVIILIETCENPGRKLFLICQGPVVHKKFKYL